VLKVGKVPVYVGCDPQPPVARPADAQGGLPRHGDERAATRAQGFYAYNVMHWTIRLADMPLALRLQGGQSNEVHGR